MLEHMHRTEGGKRQALGEAFGRLGGVGTRVELFYPGILESQVTIYLFSSMICRINNHNMKKDNVHLSTVSELLGELKKYKKNHWDDCVVAWLNDDELTFGVVGMGNDKDGDLRIIVEEVDDVLEGFWTVDEVISSLECKGKDARVYLAGEGLYLAIDSRGGIFTEADDDDTVGCYVTVFGEYEERPQKAPAPGKAKGNRGETIALIAIMAGSALLVFYKAYTLITGTGGPVWESVLYIVGASIAAAVGGLSLYYSKEDGR